MFFFPCPRVKIAPETIINSGIKELEKILIIEDEEYVRSSIRDLLLNVGYEVLEASNGRQGLEITLGNHPDLIISDIMMPEMDGHALLEELQKNPLTSSIPFIFLTARVNLSDMRTGMNLGADDYITKPFRLGDLLQAISKRLEKKRRFEERIKSITDNIIKYIPHELRTPLVSIAGFSDIILNDFESLEPGEVLAMAGRIKHGSLRLHETIEKFLTLMETELMEKNPEYRFECYSTLTGQPGDVIRKAASARALKTKREKDLEVHLGCNCPVYITSAFLNTIVSELLDNAAKFSKQGSSIKLSSFCEGGYLKIEVEDNGTGMTPNQIASVAPFAQFNRDYAQQSGNGLGLAIIKNILEICGGFMNIESRPDEYTKVSVCLRAAEDK